MELSTISTHGFQSTELLKVPGHRGNRATNLGPSGQVTTVVPGDKCHDVRMHKGGKSAQR